MYLPTILWFITLFTKLDINHGSLIVLFNAPMCTHNLFYAHVYRIHRLIVSNHTQNTIIYKYL
jgi:hypothetical protein